MRPISDSPRVRQFIIAGWYLAAVLAGTSVLMFVPQWRAAEHGARVVLLKELGQGVPITQAFDLTADGLHAIELQLWASAPADAIVEYQVTLTGGDGPAATVRGKRNVRARAGVQPLRIEFPEIRQSGDHACAVRIRASEIRGVAGETGSRPEMALVASRDRPARRADLTVGADDRWGSLHFETAASGDTLFGRLKHKTLQSLPSAVRNSVAATTTIAIALYSLLLIPFIGLLIEKPDARTPDRLRQGHAARGRVLLGAAICTFLAAALGIAWWTGMENRRQKYLMDQLHEVDIRTSGPLHAFFDLVYEQINGEAKWAMLAHATTRLAWPVTPAPGTTFRTWAALQPGIWGLEGDGVTFRVQIKDGDATSELVNRHLDPTHVPGDRRWVPIEVDLSPYAGRQIELVLLTDPSPAGTPPNSHYDRALWGDPRIGAKR